MVYTNPRIASDNLTYENRDSLVFEELNSYAAAKNEVFQLAINRLFKFFPPPAFLIDVGCGSGVFLEIANKCGYKVLGVESSKVDVKYIEERFNFSVLESRFESLNTVGLSADIVTMWDVIEHVSNPRDFIRKANMILNENGVLAMRFPGATFHRIKSVFLKLFRQGKGNVYSPVIHLNFFSPVTIRKMLSEESFDIIETYTTTPEGLGSKGLLRIMRITWGKIAYFIARLTGIYLDNIEVYARKRQQRKAS
ncbi:MAG: class I SAM-dependent methyltransferase [Candidatus Omnitrophica bacterium]|nr:class I SAM-dependent methyltransferase [Candidatus Omnitrophota bacterium]